MIPESLETWTPAREINTVVANISQIVPAQSDLTSGRSCLHPIQVREGKERREDQLNNGGS